MNMPVTCKLQDEKWRLIEADSGKLSTNKEGTPSDGGGHSSRGECMSQARAINANIKNQAQEICLYGICGYDYTASNFRLQSGQPTIVKINSKGGSFLDAIQIYNMIRMHNAEVTTYIEGVALSAGATIALAGHKVQMASNALMMIHSPKTSGYAESDEDDLRKMADVLSKAKQSLITTLCGKTGMKPEEISSMLDNETWMTAAEAKEKKFVDEIVETSLKRLELENLSGIPDRIVALFRGDDLMPLKDLAAKLQVEVKDGFDDDKITNLIVEK